jgi:hypothetical protein
MTKAEWQRQWRAANPEKMEQYKVRAKEWGLEYREANKEEISQKKAADYQKNKEKVKARRAKYKKENPEKVKKFQREYWYKKKYGITYAQRMQMEANQEGKCAICNEAPPGGHPTKGLCVDHCHTTKKLRELLCRDCNLLIGDAKEDPEIFKRAIAYLEKHK